MSAFEPPEPFDDSGVPYPLHYQTRAFAKDGSQITMRPIKPEDATLLVEFFNALSQRTIFLRFFGELKELPPKWVKHFTRINYARDVAMVAIEETESRERILGVCRIMREGETSKGEYAVVVADAWQGRGIGIMLSEYSISIARRLGTTSIWGIVSPENNKMILMARQLGFSVKMDAEAEVIDIEMALKKIRPV